MNVMQIKREIREGVTHLMRGYHHHEEEKKGRGCRTPHGMLPPSPIKGGTSSSLPLDT
jgi:hypothetical protein